MGVMVGVIVGRRVVVGVIVGRVVVAIAVVVVAGRTVVVVVPSNVGENSVARPARAGLSLKPKTVAPFA